MGRDAIPDLREMLKDENRGVRRAAAETLARVTGQAAIPDLREMLEDENRGVRRAAAEALAQVAGRDAIPDLREMLKDEDVRWAAVEALARVAGRDAIPDLRAMLKDEDEIVGAVVLQTLEMLVTENDLAWLVEWVIRYPLAQAGALANRLLIHLDRRLYSPA